MSEAKKLRRDEALRPRNDAHKDLVRKGFHFERYSGLVHPLSTVLFLIGYGLALPVAFRMSAVVGRQHRLALAGHQLGVLIGAVGWLVRGSLVLVAVHAVWMIGARLWFLTGSRR